MRKEEKYLNNLLEVIKHTDVFFLQLTFAIAIIGLIFAFTSSTSESYRIANNFWALGLKQSFAFIIGLFLLFLFWFIDYSFFYKHTLKISFVVLVLMILTVFTPIGKTIGGSQRWIDLGFFQIQPAEIAKLSIIILCAKQLTVFKWFEKQSYSYLGFSILLTLIILKQPDLGTALILLLLIFQLLFIYEWPLWLLLIVSGIGAYGCYYKILSTPYQSDRLKFWLNPYLEPLGRGYNHIQAQYALGLGGLFGVGLGNSTQKQGYLPVPHSDFIFAIIGEEIGFIGAMVVCIILLTWLLRGLFLLSKVENKFGSILGTGIILLICTQSIVNICVAIGLFPITGVTLPFFSCGGTSLIVTLAMCGILFNIFSTKKTKKYF